MSSSCSDVPLPHGGHSRASAAGALRPSWNVRLSVQTSAHFVSCRRHGADICPVALSLNPSQNLASQVFPLALYLFPPSRGLLAPVLSKVRGRRSEATGATPSGIGCSLCSKHGHSPRLATCASGGDDFAKEVWGQRGWPPTDPPEIAEDGSWTALPLPPPARVAKNSESCEVSVAPPRIDSPTTDSPTVCRSFRQSLLGGFPVRLRRDHRQRPEATPSHSRGAPAPQEQLRARHPRGPGARCGLRGRSRSLRKATVGVGTRKAIFSAGAALRPGAELPPVPRGTSQHRKAVAAGGGLCLAQEDPTQ